MPDSGRPALQIEGLTKRYDDGTLALDSLYLTIADGAFFGLLGLFRSGHKLKP